MAWFGMSERATPYLCPYCGEDDLRPSADDTSGWECRSCLRAFVVRMLGMIKPEGGLR